MPEIRLVIPGPPRGWQRTGQRIAKGKTGAFIVNYTTGETRADEWTLKRAATEAMGDRIPLTGPIDLRITAWFAVPMSWSDKKRAEALTWGIIPTTKPDFDNITKLIDGIKGVVWRDDALVSDFHFYKRYGTNPRTVISVRSVNVPATRAQRFRDLGIETEEHLAEWLSSLGLPVSLVSRLTSSLADIAVT